ncbi:MAG: hypothetical protein AB8D78_09725 [Akkermansiaceae bacterium]
MSNDHDHSNNESPRDPTEEEWDDAVNLESSGESSEKSEMLGSCEMVGKNIPASNNGGAGLSKVREISPKNAHESRKNPPKKFVPKVEKESPNKVENKGVRKRRRVSRGEKNDWGEKTTNSSTRWMLYSGLGIVGLVMISLLLTEWNMRDVAIEPGVSRFGELVEEVESEPVDEGIEVLSDPLADKQNLATEIYAKFVTAKSIDDLRDIVFKADRVMPIIESSWKPIDARPNWSPDDLTSWAIVEEDELRFGLLAGMGPDFMPFGAFFHYTDSGLKLDWKATTGYSSAPFSELKKGQGNAEEVRALLSSADFYTVAFPDDQFRAYRMTSPDEETILWGYVNSGSDLAKRLTELFETGQITGESNAELQVTLSLVRGPEGALSNQWIIHDFICLNWIER